MASVLGPIGSLPDHALRYALAGLAVFPANPNTKAPLVAGGMKDATTDEATVIGWWERYPAASIAHRLPAGVVVCDIDFRHGGDTTWAALKAEFELPETRVHYSGRGDGGGHVWFTVPDVKLSTHALDEWAGQRGVGEWNGHSHKAGIDLLHHGHRYTILPPSVHASSGKPYRWKEGHGLATPIAAMPEWLFGLLRSDGPEGDSNDVAKRRQDAASGPSANTVDDSIADWFTATRTWASVLQPAGWRLGRGDGEYDGSEWLHPAATSDKSATVRHGCLFVYSSSTPFEVTEDGNPHGYTRFGAWALLAHHGDKSAAARAARVERDGLYLPPAVRLLDDPDPDTPEADPFFIDWPTFFAEDRTAAEWIFEDVLARGRGHSFIARAKVGKSLLALHIAAIAATRTNDPALVIYLDYEMSPDDLFERLDGMGYGTDTDLSLLRYAMLPTLPPLDTPEGAAALLVIVDREAATRPTLPVVVIIDTLGRAVAGEENSADTVRAFYSHTGLALKRRGVTWARLDHVGKDATKLGRGSSAKNDDVDVVWIVERTDEGLRLKRAMARVAWIPERVEFRQEDAPLTFTRAEESWPAGTKEAAERLAALGVAVDASTRVARAALKLKGEKMTDLRLRAALRWRQREAEPALL